MCRLLGDDAGGILMEYVVLGVLIVAAVATAVIMFSGTIQRAFGIMGSTTTGKPQEALNEQNTSRQTEAADDQAAQQYNQQMTTDQ